MKGVWPVTITPFTADSKIDYDAVLRIIEWSAKDPALLTGSRKLAIDRFYAREQMFAKHFFG